MAEYSFKGQQGFGQGFPTLLKLSHTVQLGQILSSPFIVTTRPIETNWWTLKNYLGHQKLEHVQMPTFHFLFLLD